MIHLVPTYRQKLKSQKPFKRPVPQWTSDSIQRLQGCYACTEWVVFTNSAVDLDGCTDLILDYMRFCQEICIDNKLATVYANEKPWFGHDFRSQLRNKMDAHQSGDEGRIKAAKYQFRAGVRDAKRRFKEKLDEDFSSASSRDLWMGMSKVTGYKPKSKGITVMTLRCPTD